ncbi:hypothetical protein pb186bvf_007257 [Paramecium bursaria]
MYQPNHILKTNLFNISIEEVDLLPPRNRFYFDEQYLHIDDKLFELQGITMEYVKQINLAQFEYQGDFGILLTTVQLRQRIISLQLVIQNLFQYLKNICFIANCSDFYKFIRYVGRGVFSKIFKAQLIKNSKHKVAIKRIKISDFIKDQGNIEILYKQIGIMRRIKHENCLQLTEAFKGDKYVFLVVELLRGSDIFRFLSTYQNQLNEAMVRDMMQVIFESLDYLHSNGIIHRDIIPQNILLRQKTDYQDLVIIDFTSADYQMTKEPYGRRKFGTLGYTAPEVLKEQQYDCKIDVYSVGVILYQLFTGLHPFKKQGLTDKTHLLQNNLKGQYDLNLVMQNNVSAYGVDFLKGCLLTDPKQRMSSQEALRHEWFKIKDLNSNFTVAKSSFVFETRNFDSILEVRLLQGRP